MPFETQNGTRSVPTTLPARAQITEAPPRRARTGASVSVEDAGLGTLARANSAALPERRDGIERNGEIDFGEDLAKGFVG